ncbi:beta-glucosidase BglX [Butyrivibrio sp. VCB2006]|uniref:beta-glucosidase BglX n=1 Tax=Butyrivibrio sp. VCB2006 TaxID=1280679 RepID=UPI0004050C47|nr:beta-glucosidase BglX [Butyrivibrio sp. VCB2006]
MEKEKLQALLHDMSLEEKIMQLVQLPGQTFEESAALTGLADMDKAGKMKTLAGSVLGLHGADKIKEIQKTYMDNHPHNIPLLFMLDVIHGHDTVFPCPLAQGATFDPEVAEKGAAVQAKEASADGVQVTFSPMADLVRDARWGRVVESTGEDPYLNGLMTAAMVRGYQGSDIKDKDHVAACVKHFAAYGAAEAGRDYNTCEISEHTLRDQYLQGYRAPIAQGARLVMTSFNTLNGVPSSGNKWLMRDILRDEMGFEGVLISDWGAIMEMVNWGFAEDLKAAAAMAMEAGVDIDMCTEAYSDNLEALVKEGKLKEDLLDEAVMRVLELKNDLGLFEDPYHGASEERYKEITLSKESRDLARDAVRKSLVLLENKNGVLPLNSKKIALIGPYVDEKKTHSAWAITCNDDNNITMRMAFEEEFAGSDVQVKYANGCTLVDNDCDLGFMKFHSDTFEEDNEKLLAEALEVSDECDTIIMCLGESLMQSGESTSRADIRLPKVQRDLYNKVKEKGKKLITLIFTGRPLDLEDIPQTSDALMIVWRPGTESGHGITDVLTGKFSPQGKLSMSFPWLVGQEPLYYNRFNTGRPKPAEGNTIFTSRYLDCPNEARYPFGYGLTYSDFEISKVKLSSDKMHKHDCGTTLDKNRKSDCNLNETIKALVTVKNTGSVAATQTLQLYIRDMAGSTVRPIKELKGFKKVSLQAGESAEVSFEITEEMLRFWTASNKFESEPGKFKVFIGFDSATDNEAEFELI